MTNDDLPPVFAVADAKAGRFQRRYFLLQRCELIALVASAVSLELSWTTSRFDLGALLGAALLAVALATRILERWTAYETRWRRSRSEAEATKAIAWQYAVGGGTYPATIPDDEAQSWLADSISQVGDSDPGSAAGHQSYVTEAMQTLRQAPLDDRRAVYLQHRLHQQRAWYAKTAATNERATSLWSTAVGALEAVALAMAFAVGFNWLEFGWGGVLGAAAAAGLAWHQAKQHSQIAASYNSVCQNLKTLEPRFHNPADPETWAALVGEAEALFASEHTLWRHRRTRS